MASPARTPAGPAEPDRRPPAAAPAVRLSPPPGVVPATLPVPVREAVIDAGGGAALAPEVSAALRHSLGVDPSPVRVHADSRAAAATTHLGVRAFTWGSHVYLGPGERADDLRLLAHEVVHAIQQSGGAAVQLFDGPHGALEAEAHSVASTVLAGGRAQVRGRTSGPVVQGLFDWARRAVSAVGSAIADAGAFLRDKVLGFVKDKAAALPGYDLLGFILGRDPVTQRPVQRTAVTLVGAVLGLIPGGHALFENLQKANVIQRAFDWLGAETAKLDLSWSSIRALFARAWDELSLSDLASPGSAWEKLKNIFGPPLRRLADFAVAAGRKVLEFVFEGALALAGSAGQQILAIFRRVGAVFSLIVDDPLKFLGNLLAAVKGGFGKFKDNILAHLRTGLFEWLLGSLEGVTMPGTWDFAGILQLVLQILGLTYTALRAVLVKLMGEPAVAAVEKVFDFLVVVVSKGLGAAWDKIKEFASDLADQVIGGIRDWVAKSVVGAAVTKLVTMFNPVGAIIQGIIAIYNTVMFFIERAKQIARLVNSVLDSVENIARGNLSGAIAYVERAMANTLPVILGFLARLLGLGNVTGYVRDIVTKIRATIANAVEKVGLWIKDKVKGLLPGKAGPEAQAPPATKSEAVRRKALAELTKDIGAGLSREQAGQAVRQVGARLRPEGLQRLEIGPPDSDGALTISAAASDFLPLAKLASREWTGGRRTVKLFSEIRFEEPVAMGPAELLPVDKEGRPLGPGETGVRTAGVILRQPRPDVLRTATWNTANADTHENVSHAEHHFISWLESQLPGLPRVRRIMLNLQPYSPCATCTEELVRVAGRMVAARGGPFGRGDATLTWAKPYPGIGDGINRTTAPGVNALIGAGWTVHAPPVGEGDPLRTVPIIIVPPDYRRPA
jgi:hypothetical protein